VGGAHPGLEGAERVFDGRATDAHALRRAVQPVLHGVDYGLMLGQNRPVPSAGHDGSLSNRRNLNFAKANARAKFRIANRIFSSHVHQVRHQAASYVVIRHDAKNAAISSRLILAPASVIYLRPL
jgi:hypothetical protein